MTLSSSSSSSSSDEECRSSDRTPLMMRRVKQLPDGRLVTCADDDEIRVWSSEGRLQHTLKGSLKALLRSFACTLASVSEARYASTLFYFLTCAVPGHMNCIRGIAAVPGTNWLVSCSDDFSLRVWELPDCTPAAPGGDEAGPARDGHKGPINAVAVLPRGLVASGGSDCRVVLWDLQGQQKAVRLLHILSSCPPAPSCSLSER